MQPYKNWTQNANSSLSTSYTESDTIGARATVGTAGGSGSLSEVFNNPVFRSQLSVDKVVQLVRSRITTGGYATLNLKVTATFTKRNLSVVRVRWFTYYLNNDNRTDQEAYLAYIRLTNDVGTVTEILGRTNYNSTTLTTNEVSGDWANIVKIELGFYSNSFGQPSGTYQTQYNGSVQIGLAYICCYDGIEEIPLYIRGASANRQLCKTTNETALKFRGVSKTFNLAIVNDADPNEVVAGYRKGAAIQGASKKQWLVLK